MLEQVFLQILNMSFAGGVAIALLLVARLALCRLPKRFSYALWSVALLRLLCPFSFDSVWSLFPVHARPIARDIAYAEQPRLQTGVELIDRSIALPPATPYASVNPMQIWIFVGAILWCAGFAALIIAGTVSFLRLRSRLRGAAHAGGNLYTCEGLETSFVLGLFRPRIYLPAQLDEDERRYILLHEQTHIRRLDHAVKLLSFVTLALHWFNPLVWAAFVLSGRDMEMSCDERVVELLGRDVKQPYTSSLLRLATGKRMPGAPLAFGEGDTGPRIRNVLRYRKPAFWIGAAVTFAVVAVVTGLAANPRRDTMSWAKSLRVEDVQRIELLAMLAGENEQYRDCAPETFDSIVNLVRQSRGNYVPMPESLAGGGLTYYITTRDGVLHSVGNNGNVYLTIDGDSFEAGHNWLSGWLNERGDSGVPDDFWIRAGFDVPEKPPAHEYHIMTARDNAPYGCEFGVDKDHSLDTLEMLGRLETMQGFTFFEHEAADQWLQLQFPDEQPEDVYLRYISQDVWQEPYALTPGNEFQVPGKAGEYSFFADITWPSSLQETAYFHITVLPDLAYSLALIQNGETVAELAPEPGSAEYDLTRELMFSYYVVSAAFEGSPIETLPEYVRIHLIEEGDMVSAYYAYELDGHAVVQSMADGLYSRASDEFYAQVRALFAQ